MYKKLITACMAIAAFAAFVVPSTASATNDPVLMEGKTVVGVGEKIVATNVGETTFVRTNKENLVHCTTALMTGTVHRNDSGFVEGTITTSDFSGTGSVSSHNNLKECTGDFGNAYITVTGQLCIRSTPAMATDEFQVSSTTGTCGGLGNPTFVIGSTTIGTCEYETTGPVKGDYNTVTDTLTVRETQEGSGASKTHGSFLCPSSGMLKMTFSLETENGTAVTIE